MAMTLRLSEPGIKMSTKPMSRKGFLCGGRTGVKSQKHETTWCAQAMAGMRWREFRSKWRELS